MFRNGRFQAASTARSARWRSDQIQVRSGGMLMIGIGAFCISVARASFLRRLARVRALHREFGFPEVAHGFGVGPVWSPVDPHESWPSGQDSCVSYPLPGIRVRG